MFKRKLSSILVLTLISSQIFGFGAASTANAAGQSESQQSFLNLTNASLEDPVTDGVIPGWKMTGSSQEDVSLAVTSEQFKTGKNSLKLVDESSTHDADVQSELVGVIAGRDYKVTTQVYLESLSDQSAAQSSVVYIRYYDANKAEITGGAGQEQAIQEPLKQWTPVTIDTTAPSSAAFMSIGMSSSASSKLTAYYDDMSVTTEVEELPKLEWVEPAVKDLASGSDLLLKVKAPQDAKLQVLENGKVVAEGTGAGNTAVALTVEKPTAGAHHYSLTAYVEGIGSSETQSVPQVNVHAYEGIALEQAKVRLKVGAAHEVVTNAVYGPITQDVSDYVKLTVSSEDIISLDGNTVTAEKEGNTVVTVTYGDKQTKLNVRVSDKMEDELESIRIELPSSITVRQSVYAAVYADYWVGNSSVTSQVYDNVVLTANPSSSLNINGLKITGAQASSSTVVTAVYGDQKATATIVVKGNSDSGSGWYPPYIPPTVDTNGQQKVTREQLKLVDGKASVTFDKDKVELLIPVGAIDWLSGGVLEVVRDEATLRIPVSLFKDMLDDLKLTAKDVEFLVVTVKPGANGLVTIKLGVKQTNGTYKAYTSFAKEIELLLPIPSNKDVRFLGVYAVAANQADAFAGGKRSGSWLRGKITKEGDYVVKEWNKQFADVPSGHWASMAIRTLNAKFIVNGINETQFRPNGNITRAEFAAIVVRAFELKTPTNTTSKFKDVSKGAWYADIVAAAVAADVTRGMTADTFAPNATITREQMAAMIVRASGAAGNGSVANLNAKFKDAGKISNWARESTSIAVDKGWIQGKPGGKFDPKASATRAESAMMLYNMFQDVFK